MTVFTTNSKIELFCNGITDEFGFNFKINKISDLVVTLTNPIEPLVPDVHFSLIHHSEYNGIIKLLYKPAAGRKIIIERKTPLTQTVDLKNQGEFYPELIENIADKVVMVTQELNTKLINVEEKIDFLNEAGEIDADTLDGKDLTYVLNYFNHTNIPNSHPSQIDTAVALTHQHPSTLSDIEDAVSKRHQHTSTLSDIEDAVSKRHQHTSSLSNIEDAVNRRHTQNTDVGTNSATFRINTAGIPVSLNASIPNVLQIRDGSNNNLINLSAHSILLEDSSNINAGRLNGYTASEIIAASSGAGDLFTYSVKNNDFLLVDGNGNLIDWEINNQTPGLISRVVYASPSAYLRIQGTNVNNYALSSFAKIPESWASLGNFTIFLKLHTSIYTAQISQFMSIRLYSGYNESSFLDEIVPDVLLFGDKIYVYIPFNSTLVSHRTAKYYRIKFVALTNINIRSVETLTTPGALPYHPNTILEYNFTFSYNNTAFSFQIPTIGTYSNFLNNNFTYMKFFVNIANYVDNYSYTFRLKLLNRNTSVYIYSNSLTVPPLGENPGTASGVFKFSNDIPSYISPLDIICESTSQIAYVGFINVNIRVETPLTMFNNII